MSPMVKLEDWINDRLDRDEKESDHEELRGVFPRDGVWGHKIVCEETTIKDGEMVMNVYGWLSPRLKVGDRYGFQMESGKVCIFEVIEVDNKLDPKDMFFGKAKALGYAEDVL